jgi:hypothetical protein
MKKVFIFAIIISFVFSMRAFSQDKTNQKTIDKINTEVEKKMEQIRNSGKKGPFVEEIKIKKGVKKEEINTEIIPEKSGYIGVLSTLNIIGGIFEGAIIGAGCGLIGYAQLDNRDANPLINGAIIGAGTGFALSSVLSLVQLNSKKYIASDDFGLNLIGGAILGGMLGAAGGAISFGNTDRMEDVTLGIGYGTAIGSAAGFILAIVEYFLPENIRGGAGYGGSGRAMNVILNDKYALLEYNFNL